MVGNESDELNCAYNFPDFCLIMSQPMFVTAPTLGSGNLRDVVRLPDGEDKQEWLAVNS